MKEKPVSLRDIISMLYKHQDTVEALVRMLHGFSSMTIDQVFQGIVRATGIQDDKRKNEIFADLIRGGILRESPRSDDLQFNPYVLEFVRSITQENELGLASVLKARVDAIREATGDLNLGSHMGETDRMRSAAVRLAELFRQITMQLEQDRNAILDLAEKVRSADDDMPTSHRYRDVLEAYDRYVEPMNELMDSSADGYFYKCLEGAETALDEVLDQMSARGALYSHILQIRQVSYQAKELRHFGRVVAQQCADTLLPLREELFTHNRLTSAISLLLGLTRKRGLRHALRTRKQDVTPPLWCRERGFRLYLGDEVLAIMASALKYQPQTVAFPRDEPDDRVHQTEQVDEESMLAHLIRSLPVDDLLAWLHNHYGHLQDATLLRFFHDLQHEAKWHFEAEDRESTLDLQKIRVLHHPHSMSAEK
jgi:hypothetical protein